MLVVWVLHLNLIELRMSLFFNSATDKPLYSHIRPTMDAEIGKRLEIIHEIAKNRFLLNNPDIDRDSNLFSNVTWNSRPYLLNSKLSSLQILCRNLTLFPGCMLIAGE